MNYGQNPMLNRKVYSQQTTNMEGYLNPDVISIPWGYKIEVFAQGLDTPISIVFTENGDMLIGDSGVATANPKVIRLSNGQFTTVAEGFRTPLTGINYRNGDIYVSHRGIITVIKADGTREDIISGLPSYGDFSNNQVTFSQDGKMYFGQGTATNSGVVGLDNGWIFDDPFFCDYPGSYVLLNGINYSTKDILIPNGGAISTGGFAPFGIPNSQMYEVVRSGQIKATGSILRANPDGSNLEMVAWGLRNPVQVRFDQYNRLIFSNQGFENRGSRPVINAPDDLYILTTGAWYGWPDYSAGDPLTLPKFAPEGSRSPDLLLASIPSIPPKPAAVFPFGSGVMGFDINNSIYFGMVGDVYIASFGSTGRGESEESIRLGAGHRLTRVNMTNGETTTFAINKTGFPYGGGLGRPTDVVFGPDGAMYVSDFTTVKQDIPNVYLPGTGAIWRITKT